MYRVWKMSQERQMVRTRVFYYKLDLCPMHLTQLDVYVHL